MNNGEQAVREAQQRFYEAFESLDIARMDAVWLREDWVECVHPGGELLRGWEEIRDSWVHIFASTQRMKLDISSVWVRVEGDVAWVACTEHVTSTYEGGFDQALVQATHIFVRRDGAWQMVAYHASPLPSRPVPTLQ